MILELLIIVIVLIVAFYLFDRYVIPVIPPSWGRLLEAILAIIAIAWLLDRYLGG